MTGRDLANLDAAATQLRSGRAAAALETIEQMLREHGHPVPPSGGSPPPPTPEPEPMRASA